MKKIWFVATTLAALVFEIVILPIAWFIREDPRHPETIVVVDAMILDSEEDPRDTK